MAETTGNPWCCAGCGRPETETGPLQTTPRAFRRPALLCARCRHRSNQRGGVTLWLLLLIPATLAWLSNFIAPDLSRPSWIQHVGGLYLFEALFILLHEVGHAVAGHAVGYRIEQVRLGYGALVAAGRLLGVEWQFRLHPYGGLCFGIHRDPQPSRGARTAFILGGPAVNLLLLLFGLAINAVPYNPDSPQLWLRLELPWTLIWGNAWLLVWSLLPITVAVDGQQLPNDALQLWQVWTGQTPAPLSRTGDPQRRRFPRLGRLVGFAVQALGGLVVLLGLPMAYGAVRERHPAPLLLGTAVLWVCGGLLLVVGRSLNRPRLRAARDLSSSAPNLELQRGHFADQERLADGLSKDSMQAFWLRSQTLLEQGRGLDALKQVREGLPLHPGCLTLREIEFNILTQLGRNEEARTSLAHARAIDGIGEATRAVLCHLEFLLLARCGSADEAVRLADQALATPISAKVRVALLDQLASMPLLHAHGEFLEQADGWSAEALALDPSPTIRATRGGVLYELGRVEEAEPLLRSVVEESSAPLDLGLSQMYLALLENRRGNKKAARHLAWAAFNHYPDRRLVERLASDGLASG